MSDWNGEKRATLKEEVDSWIEWARDKLPDDGNVPPLFNGGLGGHPWWRAIGEVPWSSRFYDDWQYRDIDQDGLRLLRAFEDFLVQDPPDLPTRFVALSVYYALAHHEGLYVEDVVSEARKRHTENLAYLIRMVQADGCHDWRTIRWEILNSYVISDWERARELYDRARKLDDVRPVGEIEVLRAQFDFLLTQDQEATLALLLWLPDAYPLGSLSNEMLFWAGLTPMDSKMAVEDSAKVMLRHAALQLETARDKRYVLSPAHRAVLARCYFLTGDSHNAAKEYGSLLSENLDVSGLNFKPAVYMSAAASCREAHDVQSLQSAIEILNKCAEEFPDTKGIHLQIARLQAQDANLPAISESLRKEEDRNPDVGQNWWVSPLIVAGDTWANLELDRKRTAGPELEMTKTLLGDYWLPFASLDPLAQDHWAYGTHKLHTSSPDGLMRVMDRRFAALALATAVEIQLRKGVFLQFQQYVQRNRLEALVEQGTRSKDPTIQTLCKFVTGKGRLTLMQMANIIDNTARPQDEITIAFDQWFRDKHVGLRRHLLSLREIGAFRNPTTHEGVPMETVDQVPNWCRRVVESMKL